MKQKYQQQYHLGIYSTFTIFNWQQCNCCKLGFRREFGWRFLGGPFVGQCGRWYYLCKQCFPTKNEAHAYAIRGQYLSIGERPKSPPPPPKPQTM